MRRGRAERGGGAGGEVFASGIVAAVVEVDGRRGLGLASAVRRPADVVDGLEFAGGVGGYVREGGIAVAADTGSKQALGADGELVGNERHAQAAAYAAVSDAVGVSSRQWRLGRDGCAGLDVGLAAILGAVGGDAGVDGFMGERPMPKTSQWPQPGSNGDLGEKSGASLKEILAMLVLATTVL
jgi:hypothetical protein